MIDYLLIWYSYYDDVRGIIISYSEFVSLFFADSNSSSPKARSFVQDKRRSDLALWLQREAEFQAAPGSVVLQHDTADRLRC